ncbi:hypothetical protein [Streptomyces sp. B15]|uniref:hypothetical protein n=1 Tax=Streptomyces sp. B15 TaxID=1537797 RepID=UPI001B38FFF1|nr:hypothetical protein [Streptomyces sp. B15]MBQ1122613.1 hypothetical protein [Streptomyces sp. B15]
MKIRQLTPDQVRALGDAFAHLRERLAPILRAIREIVRQAGAALRRLVDTARATARAVQAATVPDRPAWQSPYGPSQRSHR